VTKQVDVIFPSWPALLYTNPQYGKWLLEPLFQYQASGLYRASNPHNFFDMLSLINLPFSQQVVHP